jgi:hypothetical protein
VVTSLVQQPWTSHALGIDGGYMAQ